LFFIYYYLFQHKKTFNYYNTFNIYWIVFIFYMCGVGMSTGRVGYG